ncbi:complement factor H-like isoform X2 [Seriola dumerili]|uniref:complement factor H-like isoform X2 n=1 Tax=Seriola dumerili TaxID=41447 RepID=UPI000BBF1538|nr:complement factor H-like isoform X2 [Seriola dumerili]
MKLFHRLWLFILWLNVDESLQQNEVKCPVPVIENGYVPGDIQEYNENEILHFLCNPTYKRTEDRPSKCTKLGIKVEWSPTPACEAITCRLSLPPLEGTRYDPPFRNLFSPDDVVKITCGDRYWISVLQNTSAVATCKDDGEWTFTPICREITCNRRDVQNADILNNKQKYSYHERANYLCKDGYEGRFYLTCGETGWNGNPQCREVTCNRKYFTNSDIDGNSQSLYRYNDRVEYVCKYGYEGRFSLTCGQKGWIGSPQCTERPCKKVNISNAYITRNEKISYNHHERVQFACRNNSKRRFTVVCSQGNWTGIQSCTEKSKCGQLPVIPNREVTSQRNKYGQGESVPIICKEGYIAQINHVTCVEGKWHSDGTSLKTICAPIASHCAPPPKVENAVAVTSYQREYLSGSEVTYRCRDHYTMEGDATIICNNGQWEEKNITCTPPTLEQ